MMPHILPTNCLVIYEAGISMVEQNTINNSNIVQRSATFVIIGKPIALQRSRVNFNSRSIWDSQKEERIYFTCLLNKLSTQHEPFRGPLSLRLYSFLEIPYSRRKETESLINTYHSSPPDTSNLLKWVEDCCQEAELFKNDCELANISAVKLWCTRPRTVFVITELNNKTKFDLEAHGIGQAK